MLYPGLLVAIFLGQSGHISLAVENPSLPGMDRPVGSRPAAPLCRPGTLPDLSEFCLHLHKQRKMIICRPRAVSRVEGKGCRMHGPVTSKWMVALTIILAGTEASPYSVLSTRFSASLVPCYCQPQSRRILLLSP